MALKAKITKDEHGQLPEAARGYYVEREGQMMLDVEGGLFTKADVDDLKTKLAEFRENNRVMHGDLERLKPIGEKLKAAGIEDVTKLDAHLTEHGDLRKLKDKGISKPDDLQAAIDAALKPIKDSLANEQQARQAAEKEAQASRFRELVTAEAQRAGVKPSSIRHVLRDAESVFVLENGSLKPKPGVKHPDDPLKDLTPDAWLQQLQKTDDYLFGESAGGGANNGHRGGGLPPGVKQLINPTPEEMGKHVDDIATGKMVVVRQ